MTDRTLDDKKDSATAWFRNLRDQMCTAFEALEDQVDGQNAAVGDGEPGRFEQTVWDRPGGGGGVMSVMKGRVFEKVGVNISTVHGEFSEEFRKNIPGAEEDPRFWASGISLVAHMHSPLVPAAHMNTRFIVTSKAWFGGGGDLTPMYPNDADTESFHAAFKSACDAHDPEYYPKFKKWCDEYFFLPHRDEARGVGGIFMDDFCTGNWAADFALTQDIGRAFLPAFVPLVEKRRVLGWSEADKDAQLIHRGLYAEYNLVYDRGTKFGLETGHDANAVLMSLPPMAKWV